MKELSKQIHAKEKQLNDILKFFTLEELRTSPFSNFYRNVVKDLALLYLKQEESIHLHYKTK